MKYKLTLFTIFLPFWIYAQGSIDETQIGEQIWMSENLNVHNFQNGEPIPFAKTAEEWKKFAENQTPAYCYVPGDFGGKKYGALYNWYAVSDSRFLAPKDWHIPSTSEFEELVNYYGGSLEAGAYLKANNNSNTHSFNALKVPFCNENMQFQSYETIAVSLFCAYWSSEMYEEFVYPGENQEYKIPLPINSALLLQMYADNQIIPATKKADISNLNQGCGLSVRCIKNKW